MQNSGTYSVDQFHNRLVRWCQLRVATVPTLIFFEPISECLLSGKFIKTMITGVKTKRFYLLL